MRVDSHPLWRPLPGLVSVAALLLLGLPVAAAAFALFVVPPKPLWPSRGRLTVLAILVVLLWAIPAAATGDHRYLLGVGKADITGPVAELPFAGYAKCLGQVGGGLRQRLYSRAFIFGAVNSPDRAVYLVLDVAMGDTAVRRGIIESLEKLGPEYAAYNSQNIALVATHSHSGPAGYHNYMLPQVVSLGLNEQSLNAQIEGAVRSIRRAHENLQEVGDVGAFGPGG